MLLNNQQITEEVKKEIKICTETNENENTTTQILWDSVKAVLSGRFIAIKAYLKKQEKIQINNLTLHLKQLGKEEIKNLKVSRSKKKHRAEINMYIIICEVDHWSRFDARDRVLRDGALGRPWGMEWGRRLEEGSG